MLDEAIHYVKFLKLQLQVSLRGTFRRLWIPEELSTCTRDKPNCSHSAVLDKNPLQTNLVKLLQKMMMTLTWSSLWEILVQLQETNSSADSQKKTCDLQATWWSHVIFIIVLLESSCRAASKSQTVLGLCLDY
jgi:hypothetical protein